MGGGAIVRDGKTGEPVIGETGVTVSEVLRKLESAGREAVLRSSPELTEESVAAAVEFASEAARREVRYDGASAERQPGMVREASAAPWGVLKYGPGSLEEDIRSVDDAYERLRHEMEMVGAIREGLRDIERGDVYDHDQVMAELRKILRS